MEGKVIKNLKNSFLTLAIVNILFSIWGLRYIILGFNVLLVPILRVSFLIMGYILAKKGNKLAGYMGLLCSALMIIAYKNNPLTLILGIFLLVESIQYLRIIK